jgi:acetyl esterase
MHPDYIPYLAAQANAVHPNETTYEIRRRAYRAQAHVIEGDRPDMAEVRDISIPLNGRTVATRLFVPLEETHEAIVLYFHGGSFVLGDLDTHDALCRRLSRATGMRFLAVAYALAPEHPFPAGLIDAIDVTRYVAANGELFDVPGAPLVLMGDSAGACLAAVATVQLRHDELPIVAQVLVYPTFGPEVVTNSSHQYASGYLLEMEHLRADYRGYVGTHDHTDPRISPLLTNDATGAPAAIVVVAECDPLRDEGLAYAGLLEHFGVRVETLEAEGMLHGFLRHGSFVADALTTVDDVAHHLREYVSSTKAS